MRLFLLSFFFSFATQLGATSVVDQVKSEVKEGKSVLLDVRELSEIQGGILDGALWLPMSDFASKGTRFSKIMKNIGKKRIYVYCRSGGRAGQFQRGVANMGYKNVKNVGGFQSLVQAGFKFHKLTEKVAKPCPWLCGSK